MQTFRALVEKRNELLNAFQNANEDIAELITRAVKHVIPHISFYYCGNGDPNCLSFCDGNADNKNRKYDPESGRIKPFDAVLIEVFDEENIDLNWTTDFESPEFYLTAEEADKVKEALKNMVRYADVSVWLQELGRLPGNSA